MRHFLSGAQTMTGTRSEESCRVHCASEISIRETDSAAGCVNFYQCRVPRPLPVSIGKYLPASSIARHQMKSEEETRSSPESWCQDKEKAHDHGLFQLWRRNRDLNPGTLLQVYKLSKPAPSTTWVFLQWSHAPYQALS